MRLSLFGLVLVLGCGPALAKPFLMPIRERPGRITLRGASAMVPRPMAQVGGRAASGARLPRGFLRIGMAVPALTADWAANRAVRLRAAATGGADARAAISAPGM